MNREPTAIQKALEILNHEKGELRAEVERLTAREQTLTNTAKINLKVAQDRGVEIERLRTIALDLLAVAERLSPAPHSLARVQIDRARAALEPKPFPTSTCSEAENACEQDEGA